MTSEKSSKFIILYASQTGNAEWIAKNIHQEASERGFDNECFVMEDLDKFDLSKENVLILVSSNTGDGDPPDNATKFFRFLRKIKSKTFLSHLKFTILGLGDTNYTNFNNTAKRLEKKMLELSATPFYNKGLADDAMGLETTVDPWIANLWPELAKICVQKGKDNDAQGENVIESVKTLSLNDKTEINEKSLSSETPSGHSVDKMMDIVSGTKITLDLSELAKAEQLTALPRIPTVICKIIKSSEKKRIIDSPTFPSLINTPTPIVNARLDAVRCLTHPEALKRTIHLELDTKDYKGKLEFIPGDSFGIIAPNNEKLSFEILKTLGIDENEEISIESVEGIELPSHLRSAKSTSIMELLRYCVDLISLPRKALLRLMAEYTTDEEEKRTLLFLCSKQGSVQFSRLREQVPTLLDLFVTFPSCKPPIERLLDVLPPHQPRYYSIVNSPLVNRDSLHFAFNIVDYKTPDPYNVRKYGVCTPWLDNLSGYVNYVKEKNKRIPLTTNVYIPIFMKQNSHGFAVPSDISRPMIMIGPGTGVAPFIGFIQHREQQIIAERELNNIEKTFGEMWLFYGCRDVEKDYLYREELEGFLKRGVLKELLVAVSRIPNAGLNGDPKYVQDFLRKRGQEIYELLDQKNAMIFVCGDARGMAKDVNDTLADILVEYGKMQKSDASKLLVKWINDKRYLRDLWS